MRLRNPPVSNSAADKAGQTLRLHATGAAVVSSEEEEEARRIVSVYRDMHEYPMRKATISVGSFIKTVTNDPTLRPGQRFKRSDRIIDKLVRYPNMRLSQMEDIGGCRAVLNDAQDVYNVARRIQRYWPDTRLVDHIATPKPSGYRGLHLIARRDGRLVEVQLRTGLQHVWAQAVETWAPPVIPFNLKDDPDNCPDAVCAYFLRTSEQIALIERGIPLPANLIEEVRHLETQLRHWLRVDDEEGGP